MNKIRKLLCKIGVYKHTIESPNDMTIRYKGILLVPQVKFCEVCGKLIEIR
ncbi:NADH-dependent glutamate [Clostridium felsineum]|uniref:NADH-dependent glutamate n=1 Tax=Clostridium felsineum TaxID=36839 RepID=UPI00098C71D4|nr:NADH-dependent glutamate [Clostridium felsineum]